MRAYSKDLRKSVRKSKLVFDCLSKRISNVTVFWGEKEKEDGIFLWDTTEYYISSITAW